MKDLALKTAKLSVKIILVCVSFVLLAVVSLVGYGLLYNKDEVRLKVTDFSKPKTVTLKPYKFYPYAMMNVKIKGNVNDTIIIKCSFFPTSAYRLKGSLDTLLIQTDYYGEGPVKLTFDPYKATEGELEIDFHL